MPPTTTSNTTLIAARATATFYDPAPQAPVLAAGVVPWRVRGGHLEVLMIHRPRYDDWSWPKGKLDDGETLPQCAVRETREEIGLDIRLGIPLPITKYRLKSGTKKEVWYWAAEVTKQTPTPDLDEVDRVEWADLATARARLTNPSDVIPLDSLEAAHRRRRLRTSAFIVLRHAKAKPRASWSRAEAARPLAATGRRQALEVSQLLHVWKPKRVISSPWQRCMETVAPYVRATKNTVKEIRALTEKGAAAKPDKTAREVSALLDKTRSTVVCTHRPVLPIFIEQLTSWVVGAHKKSSQAHRSIVQCLPMEDPFLPPGAVIVAHQAVENEGKIVAVEVYDSYDG